MTDQPQRSEYTGATEQEVRAKFEAERGRMEVAGFQPGAEEWSKETRRFRPDLHKLTIEWTTEDTWSGVRFYPSGAVRAQADTPEEARTAIAELKLRKKEITLEKKELAAAATSLRADHRAKKAARGAVHRGSGGVNKTVREMQRASRASDDQAAAGRVASLEQSKAALDRQNAEIDRLILTLEREASRPR